MPEETTKPRNVFTNRNFVLAFLGAFVSNIGNILYNFAVSFYILSITDNNSFIQGAYLATAGLTFALVVLFGGVISDRFHKGKIMFICDYLKGFALIGFTLLLLFLIKEPNGQVIALFIMAVIGNIIAAIFSPASNSLLPHIVSEESFQQAQSYYSLLNSFQSIIGVILAGVLYSTISIHTLFFIVGGCYVLSGVSEMFIRYDYVKREDRLTVKAAFKDIGEAFKYLTTLKPILFLMFAVLFINFFFNPIFSNFEPYFIMTDVAGTQYLFYENMQPEMWSSIFSVAFSIGSIVTAIILSSHKRKERIHKSVSIGLLSISILVGLMVLFYFLFKNGSIEINPLLIIFVVIFIAIGVCLVFINVPTTTLMLSTVEKDKLGKVTSLIDIGSQGLIPLSEFLGGLIISTLGSGVLLITCTAGFFLVTLFVVFNKHTRQI